MVLGCRCQDFVTVFWRGKGDRRRSALVGVALPSISLQKKRYFMPFMTLPMVNDDDIRRFGSESLGDRRQ